jgi:hypothetical protein
VVPYFLCSRREGWYGWLMGRFWSTYRPGIAFLCLVTTIALSLAWGLNPSEGYLLLVLHTYSSVCVAIHFGFLSPSQRVRFLTFWSQKQLQQRKSSVEDPMKAAEAQSGQSLSGSILVLNGSLLRLLAESSDGTAATLSQAADLRSRSPYLSGAHLELRADGGMVLRDAAGLALESFASKVLREYRSMLHSQLFPRQRQESNDSDVGPLFHYDPQQAETFLSLPSPTAAASGVPVTAQTKATADRASVAPHQDLELQDVTSILEEEEEKVQEDEDGEREVVATLRHSAAAASGWVDIAAPASRPRQSRVTLLPPPPATAGEDWIQETQHLSARYDALASFDPQAWKVSTRLIAREIASRASSGASISPAQMRVAKTIALIAVLLPAIQFALEGQCLMDLRKFQCAPPPAQAVSSPPELWQRVVVFLVAAIGAFDSAFVILRLMVRIVARSNKRFRILRHCVDMLDFSSSLRCRLPFVDVRVPENATQWVAMLNGLVNCYEAKDNVNSVEILSTIMALNALASVAGVSWAVVAALGYVNVQLETFAVVVFWAVVLSVGIVFALWAEARTNDLLEALSRSLQHTRLLMMTEVASLRQESLALRMRGVGSRFDEPSFRSSGAGSALGGAAWSKRSLGQMHIRTDQEAARLLGPAERDALADSMSYAAQVIDAKFIELSTGAERSRLFGVVISFTLLRGFGAALVTTVLSVASILASNA